MLMVLSSRKPPIKVYLIEITLSIDHLFFLGLFSLVLRNMVPHGLVTIKPFLVNSKDLLMSC